MTREEAKQLVMTMTVAYPNYHPADLKLTVDVWASMLAEYDFRLVQTAFRKYILSDTSGFAPSIGQLVDHLQDVTEGDGIGELQAWSMVSAALRNSVYCSEQEYAKLPPVVQRAVGSAANLREWAMMDSATVHSVVQSNVIRNYRAAAKAKREEAKLPPEFRKLIASQKATPERLTRQESQAQLTELGDMEPDKTAAPEHVREKMEELRRQLGGGKKTK